MHSAGWSNDGFGAADAKPGDAIRARLATGSLDAEATKTNE